MIASWMIYATIVTALCAVVAALLEKVLRAHNKPTRMIWLGAIIASLALNGTAIWRSQSAAQARLTETESGIRMHASYPISNSDAGGTLSSTSPMFSSNITPASWLARFRNEIAFNVEAAWLALRRNSLLQQLDGTMLLLWGSASAITIGLFAGSAIRLRRRRASWRRASVRGVPILVTDGIGPAVVGVIESEIAMPDWIFRLDVSQQQLIVEHERQHLLARDPAVMFAALIAAAVVPWNAAMWMMVRRLRRSTEMDCDQRVLAALPAPRAYAALLVDIGSHSLPHASFGHALADPTSDLERRVSDILNGTKRITAPVVAFRIALSAALIIAACATPAPRTDVEPKPTPAPIEAPAATATAPTAATAAAADVRSEPPPAATTRATPPSAPVTATATAVQQPPTTGARGGTATPVDTAALLQRRDSIVAALLAAPTAAPTAAPPARAGGRGGSATPPLPASQARGAAGGRGRGATGAPVAVRGGYAVALDSITRATMLLAGTLDSASRAALLNSFRGPGGRGSSAPSAAVGNRGGGGQGAGAVSGAASGAILTPPGGAPGARGGVAAAGRGGRGSLTPPMAITGGVQGVAAGGRLGVTGFGGRGITQGGPPGRTALPASLEMRGTLSNDGSALVASSGTIKREGAVISNRIPSMDSVANLAARKFPQLFTDAAKTDSLTLVFALDTLGQVMMTASLPVPLQSWVSNIPRVEQIFLDIPQQEVKYGEWRSGTITARGFPSKTMSLLFVVFGKK